MHNNPRKRKTWKNGNRLKLIICVFLTLICCAKFCDSGKTATKAGLAGITQVLFQHAFKATVYNYRRFFINFERPEWLKKIPT